MAPTPANIEKALAQGVREIWASDARDSLTVNNVRRDVEEKLGLAEGFLADGDWKVKSKAIVHKEVAQCESEAPSSSPTKQSSPVKPPKPKKTTKKRPSSETKVPPKKRRKKSPSPDEESEPRELDEERNSSPEGEAVLKKAKATAKPRPVKAASRPNSAKQAKKRKVVSEDKSGEEDEGEGDAREAAQLADKTGTDDDEARDEKPGKSTKKKAVSQDDGTSHLRSAPEPESKQEQDKVDSEDSPLSNVPDSDVDDHKTRHKKVPAKDDDSSEMSEVLDEPPKAKRKSKSAEPKAKATGNNKEPAKKTTTAEACPDEAEIKKLQNQLGKCGMRKIWQFELKKYGDDNKAKMRHLKKVLKDIGMDGRFSEAKAKEIKEQRELQADLEAVQEMDQNWGTGERSTRTRRLQTKRAPKAYEEDSGEDAEDGDGSDQDDRTTSHARGSARARAGLAFLDDDEDEGDSD